MFKTETKKLDSKCNMFVRSSSDQNLARVSLVPLCNEKIECAREFIMDDSLMHKIEALKNSKATVALSVKYAYLYALRRKLGMKVSEIEELEELVDDDNIPEDESDDIIDDTDDIEEAEVAKKKKGKTKKVRNVSASYSPNIMNRDSDSDWVCKGLRKSLRENDKYFLMIKRHGINNFMESMFELIDNSKQSHRGSIKNSTFSKNRYFTVIDFCLSKLSKDEVLNALRKLTDDNFEKLTNIKGINRVIDSDTMQLTYQTYIVGALLDRFVRNMQPEECTLFFQGLDSEERMFRVFGFSDTVYKYLDTYKYRTYKGFKSEVLVRVAQFTPEEAQQEYKRYLTGEFLERYNADVKTDTAIKILKGRGSRNLVDYYIAASSPRYLPFGDTEQLTSEALKAKRDAFVNEYLNFSEYIIWGPHWNDFVDRVDSDVESKNEFLNRILKDESEEQMSIHRYAITQVDGMLLGGLTIYDTASSYTVGVSIWVDVVMRHIGIAKEAIWVLAKAIEAAEMPYKVMEFRVNSNNVYMKILLEYLGAKKDGFDEAANIDVYHLLVNDVTHKSVSSLRYTE